MITIICQLLIICGIMCHPHVIYIVIQRLCRIGIGYRLFMAGHLYMPYVKRWPMEFTRAQSKIGNNGQGDL